MRKDLLGWYKSGHPPSNYTGDLLKDPDSFVKFRYHVIIGRRGKITSQARRKLNQFRTSVCSAGTYDIFLDIAANVNRYLKNPVSLSTLLKLEGLASFRKGHSGGAERRNSRQRTFAVRAPNSQASFTPHPHFAGVF